MPRPPKGKTLTPKQERFVEEYMLDLNATQAALRAGYSERTAYCMGIENLKKPVIAKAIAERQAAVAVETGVTLQTVIGGLLREATFQGDGASHGARVSAWAKLGDHLGAFKQRLELSTDITGIRFGQAIPGRDPVRIVDEDAEDTDDG